MQWCQKQKQKQKNDFVFRQCDAQVPSAGIELIRDWITK